LREGLILTDGLWARPGSIDTESVYAYHDDMNITLSIEEEVVKRARELAKRRGKSLNDMIRDYLDRLTDPMTPEEAIFEACLLRFRPITMTTMAALLGALPLAL